VIAIGRTPSVHHCGDRATHQGRHSSVQFACAGSQRMMDDRRFHQNQRSGAEISTRNSASSGSFSNDMPNHCALKPIFRDTSENPLRPATSDQAGLKTQSSSGAGSETNGTNSAIVEVLDVRVADLQRPGLRPGRVQLPGWPVVSDPE
jgi:hypothetical protein